jgi:amidase
MTVEPALLRRPATELAALIRAGELAAVELTQAALDRIAAVDGRVGAFVDVWADDALAAAARVQPGDDRPFAGVPTAVKNNRAVAGRRLSSGSDFAGEHRPAHDHNVVRRMRDAGFVLLGATNLPEWGITPITHPRRFGPTRNPWDLERTAGGSSGGAAAAVAAGMVPVAHGNDGGGSIRIPAAACGLVGLKPHRGRVSLAPDLGWHLLVQDGMLTRTVGDAAATLDALAGAEPGDLAPPAPPTEPFAAAAARGGRGDVPRLRVALVLDPPLDHDPSPADEAAARDAAALLARLGHDVEEVSAPWRIPGLLDLFTASFGPGIASSIRATELRLCRAATPDDVEALSWALWERARATTAVDHLVFDARLHAVARTVLEWSASYDVIVTPTLATAPVPVGALDPDGPDPMGGFADGARFSPYAAICNVTGVPAITLPLGVRPVGDEAAGMPVGVHLIGRPAGEAELLAVAAQVEAAAPWDDRVAPLALAD